MARGRGAKQFFNFVKGWITESSPMTYPENTAKDLDNVILDVDGTVRRRPGLDFEDKTSSFGLALSVAEANDFAIAFTDWLNVGGSASTSFTVAQVGTSLYFHRQNGNETTATSVGTVDFSSFAINTQLAPKERVQIASGLGVLFVVGKYVEPFYITFDGTNLSCTQINISIRDFVGIADGLRVDNRPPTLSEEHLYNLLNQGWVEDTINTFSGKTSVSTTPPRPAGLALILQNSDVEWIFQQEITDVVGASNGYPSNADIMYLGMTTNSEGDLVFDPAHLKAQTFGNTPAPKGHFIIPAFNQDYSAVSGVIGLTSKVIPARPAAVAFHNGRVFYAGIDVQANTGNVYFSQQLIDLDRVGNCYQEQDPTAEDFNDLLATDGGLIPIPACGRILALREGANGIIVFAANGVWEVNGGQDPFSATNAAVRKVTDIGCVGAYTIVEADGQFLYWSDAGIIALVTDEISAQLNAQNVSKTTIQFGYQLIGGLQRRNATGTFIQEEKKIVWLYSTHTPYDGISQRFKYNGVLVLDTLLGAFYKYSISNTASDIPYVVGITKTQPFTSGIVQELVTENGVTVTANGVDVTVDAEGFTGADISAWKMLCTKASATAGAVDFTMGEFYSRSFHDWFKTDGVGVNYISYLETGYELFDNVVVDKQPIYVFTYYSPRSKSLTSGGYYELPELITFSNGVRNTQNVNEVLFKGDSLVRLSQAVNEILFKGTESKVRASQVIQEVLIDS